MYTGTVTRNDDGSYSSSHGHAITKGPDGQLYSGGASIGLTAGQNGGVVPTGWGGSEAPSSFGRGIAPSTFSFNPWHDGTASWEPRFVSLPIYLWMLFLGVAAGVVVSGSQSFVAQGLHLHPVYGVATAVLVISAYRYLMTVFPTALVVSLASSLLWAINVWVWRHAADGNAVPVPGLWSGRVFTYLTAMATRMLRSTINTPDMWVVVTGVVCLTLHFFYWRHRRRMAKRIGWLFNRGPAGVAKRLLTLAATTGVLGLLFAWLRDR